MNFNIQYTNENLQSNTGLSIFSKILNRVNPERIFRHYQFTNKSSDHFYSDKDVIFSYLALMLNGHINFEDIVFCRNDLLFKRAIGLNKVPSKK